MKHLVLAAAVMAALSSAAEAQPAVELELGGGYHHAVDLGGDWFTVPSAPSIDFRATRWGSGRWGVATRALVGIGGVLRGHAGYERRFPSYFQVLARYRAENGVHFGIGGGLMSWVDEDGQLGFAPHFLGVEFLVSRRLTDRLSIRGGVSSVVPISVTPTVVFAWGR